MHYPYSATALAFITSMSTVLGQECPSGYQRIINWVDCPAPTRTLDDGSTISGSERLQCAVLDVPLDWQAAESDTMRIPLVRVPARTDVAGVTVRNESIIVNPGGPGESGVNSVAFGGDDMQLIFGQGYDVIGFDPRGVGLSKPFNGSNYVCPSFTPAYAGPFSTEQELQTAHNYFVGQAGDCGSGNFSTMSELVGTAYVARDIVAIAEALGQDGLVRYYGYSYGTLMGATLAAMFPEKMERVVLDGNINPTDYYFGTGEEAVADVDAAVAHYFEECSQAGPDKCKLATAIGSPTGAELQAQWDQYLDVLYAADPATWYAVKGQMFGILRGPSEWINFATLLYNSLNGVGSMAKRQDKVTATDVATASAESSAQLYVLDGVTCGDYQGIKNADVNDYANFLELWNNTSKYGGDQLVKLQLQCSTWNVKAKEQFPGPFTRIKTKNPVLYVQTLYDPVTPMISAQNSSAGFEGSGVLRSAGVGHCSGAHKSTALEEQITKYLDTGVIPDTTVLYQPDEPAFDVHYVPVAGGNNEHLIPGTYNNNTSVASHKVLERLMLTARDSATLTRREDAGAIPIGCKPFDASTTGSSTTSGSSSSSTANIASAGGQFVSSYVALVFTTLAALLIL